MLLISTPARTPKLTLGPTPFQWAALIPIFVLLSAVPALAQQSTPSPDAAPPKQDQSPKKDAAQDQKPAAPASDAKPKTPEEARQAQIVADTAKLYELAQELQAEVAKSNKNTLSLAVVKKATEVEKLAKSLKDRMKPE